VRRLQLPGGPQRVLDEVVVSADQIRDEHHVLGELPGHREGIGAASSQRVTGGEVAADHDVLDVQLSRDQPAAVAPGGLRADRCVTDAVE
jgi:hypothetical protein